MNAVSSRRRWRFISAVAALLSAAVLTGQIVWSRAVAPGLSIKKIIIESDLSLTDGQLLEMLDIEGRSWAALEEEDLEARLESYPVVKRAEIEKIFPDTLKLNVYRRRPLAVAFTGEENTPVPAIFDEEGYAVKVGGGTAGLDLPVISGPHFPKPNLGARLPEKLWPILADLSNLRDADMKLFNLVSEVEILPKGEGYNLRIYMNHVRIPILVDGELTAESVGRAVLVLDVLDSGAVGSVKEADMRGGHVVFRRAEEI